MSTKAEQAKAVIRAILKGKESPSPEEISNAVQMSLQVVSADPNLEGTVDPDTLRRDFESVYQVFYRTSSQIIEDRADHEPWLPNARAGIEWNCWGRYEYFLSEVKGMAPQIVARLGQSTDEVLSRLENPKRGGKWDRRGLVVGNVQSGKTSNYSGLICKALDAGYKLVIVLAGMHKSLRSQTQMRIDQGIIGFDTSQNPTFNEQNQWIGVGTLPGWERVRVNALTNSSNEGDFSLAAASKITVSLGGDPYILVVKKNKAILENVIKWARHTNEKRSSDGSAIIHDVPLLVIDDEADNASVNTRQVPPGENPNDYDPSAINRKIRELLSTFEKRAYVGYTATPFANIFIQSDIEHETYQDDIFPKSFIINLTEPSNYVGPATVFGLDGDPDRGIASQDGLPIVVPISDSADYFPDRYKKHHDPGGIPPSLKRAIRVFILSSAARRARGQTDQHNSMLIHIARFVDVQHRVYDYVSEYVDILTRRIRFAERSSSDTIWEELESLWIEDFVPVSEDKSFITLNLESLKWEDVMPEIRQAVERIKIKEINGQASDILDYHEHADGINVIAIGGDKLSRGLTLEGLIVSYYLRVSRMYDTLMQMGRWFGYRDGYLDLCRLYTTSDLINWYRHIALANIELRQEFQTMVDCGLTPIEYGLRVRTHPSGMLITAINKSRYASKLQVSFSGRLIQTKYLISNDTAREHNYELTVKAFEMLNQQPGNIGDKRLIWRNVSHDWICAWLRSLTLADRDVDANGARLSEFIEKQTDRGALVSWTVLLASGKQDKNLIQVKFGNNAVWPVIRTPQSVTNSELPDIVALKNANILDPRDQYCDFVNRKLDQKLLSELLSRKAFINGGGGEDLAILKEGLGRELIDIATKISVARYERHESRGKKPPEAPVGGVIRDMRSSANGLLIIYPTFGGKNDRAPIPMTGFAISFPSDDATVPVEYMVNKIYQQLVLFDDEGSMDDD